MLNYRLFIPLLASLTAAAGCTQTECAEGTIERDGKCEPSTSMTDPGSCGPGTELHGDICAPITTPTNCDPATTIQQVNSDGTITCIGVGGGGCDSPIACPTPTGGTKLTICGQLYDFKNNTKFADSGGSSSNCDPQNPATSGPCALQIIPYDAIAFGTNPASAQPLPNDGVTIDKCGRYRIAGIETNGTGPFIGLGIDDACSPLPSCLGPSGVTVTVGVAVPKADGPVVQGFEGFVVDATTAGAWQSSGGPPLAGGIYAAVFRKHRKGNGDPLEIQTGAQITKGSPITTTSTVQSPSTCTPGSNQVQCAFYFAAAETNHLTIDTAATMTGANGSALVTKASVSESAAYGGTGGLGAGCRWDSHAAASLPGIVFIQIFRKIDAVVGGPCND